jgi:hypothetical protein
MLLSAQGSQAARGVKRKCDEWLRDMPLVDFGGGGGRRGQPAAEIHAEKEQQKLICFVYFAAAAAVDQRAKSF